MNIYVIGPVTGVENGNEAAFLEAGRALAAEGHEVAIPHNFISYSAPHEEAMRKSIAHMLKSEYRVIDAFGRWVPAYDGVAMLDGWEESEGVRLEKAVAEACGMECRPWREWLGGEV